MILVFISFKTLAFSSDLIYFASFEEKTSNGKTISSQLYLNPVRKSLTNTKFSNFSWDIIIENKLKKKEIMENGIKAFLLKNGKLSIESYSQKSGSKLDDTVFAYFEGYFKNNIEVIKVEKIENSTKTKVYFKAMYSPLSYPDNWSRIILKDKIQSEFKYFKSFFY
ncbi:MAG: hypothetical protein RBR53_08290 [Desulforegulaceae bacterium]|nr:hypothetical protein [Desulforegulaceae bacterium]